MKTLKNITYLLGFVLLLPACSKDDEPAPKVNELADKQVGLFAEDARQITVPQAMAESADPKAQQAASYVALSTTFATYGAYFEIPEGATKRSQPITASNGRTLAGDYIVYEWVGADGTAIAYQYSQQGDQEVFEIFIKESGKAYLKWFEIVQDTDGKKGTMEWFGATESYMSWAWEIKNDESYWLTFRSEGVKYEVISNKDLSGSLKFYNEGVLQSEMTWDSLGNGSWKTYENGSLADEGEWTA